MSYVSEHGGAGASPQSTSLVLPPLAPKIAALAKKDPHWGQVSRLEQWRRWLGKTKSAEPSHFGEASELGETPASVEKTAAQIATRVESSVGSDLGPEPAVVVEVNESGPRQQPGAAQQDSLAPVVEEQQKGADAAAVSLREHDQGTTAPAESVAEPLIDQKPVGFDVPSEAASEIARETAPEVAVEVTPAPVQPAPAIEVEQPTAGSEPESRESGFSRIKRALSRTGQGFEQVFLGQKKIDDELLEDLETQLLTADLGMEVTTEVIDALTESVQRKELSDVTRLQEVLRQQLVDILKPCETPLNLEGQKPFVLLTVGVNGVGKTTTIGKLAKKFLNDKRSVMLAAGDTFRAAAVEQLQTWGERNEVPVIAQHTGADSASVIFDALESAKARKTDVLVADTAGRLHTKDNLMEELKKIKRVMAKLDGSAPHEVLLVLDAGTGQNAVNQLEQFHNAVGVTGIVLTKLDGTAKGGVIFALCRKFGIPVRFIGVGEGVDDLQPFDAESFVDALLTPVLSKSDETATIH